MPDCLASTPLLGWVERANNGCHHELRLVNLRHDYFDCLGLLAVIRCNLNERLLVLWISLIIENNAANDGVILLNIITKNFRDESFE
jgi:hypothetical protein